MATLANPAVHKQGEEEKKNDGINFETLLTNFYNWSRLKKVL